MRSAVPEPLLFFREADIDIPVEEERGDVNCPGFPVIEFDKVLSGRRVRCPSTLFLQFFRLPDFQYRQ